MMVILQLLELEFEGGGGGGGGGLHWSLEYLVLC